MERKLTLEKLAETLKKAIEEINHERGQLHDGVKIVGNIYMRILHMRNEGRLDAYKSILYRIENDIE